MRQAIAHAIDRKRIAALYGAGARLSRNMLVLPEKYLSRKNDFYDYDLKKAAAILDEAGWTDSDGDGVRDKDGVMMKIFFQTSITPIRQAIQRIVKETLNSLGIQVELNAVDASVFFNFDPNNVSWIVETTFAIASRS